MRSVSQRSEQRQPTIRLENASRTAASQNTPCPYGMRVASPTQSRLGVGAVKSRLTRSGAGSAFGFCLVEAVRRLLAQDRALQAVLARHRFDPEPVTEMPVGFHYRLVVGSISWAKKALAAFKISFARRSSAFPSGAGAAPRPPRGG